MDSLLSIKSQNSFLRKATGNFWFPPLSTLIGCLLVAGLLVIFNSMNSAPGMRRSFVVMIMPFAIFSAGLTAPLFYWLMARFPATGYKLIIKALVIASLIMLASYGVGWIYFKQLLNVPAPDAIWRFILQDIFAISMPFWIAQAGMSSLRRLFQSAPVESIPTPEAAELTSIAKTDVISASHGNNTHLLKSQEVIWAKADGNYVKLFTKDRFFLKHISLTRLASEFPGFIRIHRSYLLNVDFLESITPLDHGDVAVKLKSGETLKCSRGYAPKLREAMKGSAE